MWAGAQVCNPSAGEVEADEILGLSGQPGLLGELQNTGLASEKQNKTNRKTKMSRGTTPVTDLCILHSPHACAQTCISTHKEEETGRQVGRQVERPTD